MREKIKIYNSMGLCESNSASSEKIKASPLLKHQDLNM